MDRKSKMLRKTKTHLRDLLRKAGFDLRRWPRQGTRPIEHGRNDEDQRDRLQEPEMHVGVQVDAPEILDG